MLDLLIRGGLVVDGSGSPPFSGDVAVEEGRIAAVGELDGADARETIDAAGRIVCPGFVDPHSHSDFTLLTNPDAQSTIRQGVTTEVVGNCGWTYAPVSDESRSFIEGRMRVFAYDGLTGEEIVVPVSGEEAAEVYRHPFAYTARSVKSNHSAGN